MNWSIVAEIFMTKLINKSIFIMNIVETMTAKKTKTPKSLKSNYIQKNQ